MRGKVLMATCFFIGHRDAKDSLLPTLIAEVEHHIVDYGVTEFVVGCYGQFVFLAAKVKGTISKRPLDLPKALPPGRQTGGNTERL